MAVAARTIKGEFSFIWRIENLSYCLQNVGESIKSPKFTIAYPSYGQYFLELFPRGVNDEYVVCRLYLDKEYASGNRTEISVFILDKDFLNPLKTEYDSCKRYSWIRLDKIPHSRFFGLKENSILPNDVLTIGLKGWNLNGTEMKPNRSLACTRIGIETNSFIWAVKEFSKLVPFQERVHSFQTSSGHPAMTMKLFLGRITNQECIEFQIKQVETSICNLVVCKIFLLNVDGNVTKSMRQEHRFQATTGEQIWNFPSFISKGSLMDNKAVLLPNDVLSLQFEFITSIGIMSNQFEEEDITNLPPTTKLFPGNAVDPNKTTSRNLKKDLLRLYEQKKFCDVTLQVGSNEFPVHKSILCARSSVFFAMFERDMTENQTGIVDIPDLEPDTVQRMILFLYTDTVQELHLDSASKLYFAADKYRILPLREKCSTFMKSQLDANNVFHVLVLADRHLDEDLKLSCQQFISNSDREIVTSDEWKTFEKNNIKLAFDTFRFLYLNKT